MDHSKDDGPMEYDAGNWAVDYDAGDWGLDHGFPEDFQAESCGFSEIDPVSIIIKIKIRIRYFFLKIIVKGLENIHIQIYN